MSLLDRLDSDIPSKNWIRAHLDYPHEDWCLIWPFGRNTNGYGHFGGGNVLVHRLMCEYKHGPAPTDKPFAAHSCDRGHEACVNPNHVSWKTPRGNQLDRFRGRPVQPRRKLTPEQVDEIRALKDRARMVDVAAKFGISEPNVRLIQSGKTWRMDSRRSHIFTREELLRIKSAPQADGVTKAFAKEFGVHLVTIQRIRSGTYYKWFSESADPGSRLPLQECGEK